MAALLIKDLPPELHQKLRESAARHRRSLTKEALVLLEDALRQPRRAAAPPQPFKGRIPLTQDLLDRAKAEGRD
jgi:hypothetical protein